jgi:hypothetical protein
MRVTLMAMLGKVRIPLQVDIGAGDAVVPPPDTIDYPGLLDLPRARVRVYRPETSVAEKTEAMVRLALANSRMKDFFDIRRLSSRPFDGEPLRLAISATLERRQTPLPSDPPLAVTDEFAADPQRGRQSTGCGSLEVRGPTPPVTLLVADRFVSQILARYQPGQSDPRPAPGAQLQGRLKRRLHPEALARWKAGGTIWRLVAVLAADFEN